MISSTRSCSGTRCFLGRTTSPPSSRCEGGGGRRGAEGDGLSAGCDSHLLLGALGLISPAPPRHSLVTQADDGTLKGLLGMIVDMKVWERAREGVKAEVCRFG